MTDWMFDENGNPLATASRHLSVRNSLSEIATVTEALEVFARTSDLPDRVVWRFHLAIEELFRNLVAHAFPDSGEHEIEILFDRNATHLTATISDDGIPFNPLNAPPPDLSAALEEREVGGLGIHLARNVVDDLVYVWDAGRNVVTLRSRL